MSRHSKNSNHHKLESSQTVEVKTKFDAEFRRFSLPRSVPPKYDEFRSLIERLYRLSDVAFLISYTDPRDGDLLPINNDDNLARAIVSAKPLLRIIIQRKGESLEELNGYGTIKPRNLISTILGGTPGKSKGLCISNPHDFRQVSAIIDVDVVPEMCRRVRLLKHGSERPLGFYIRDGTSVRVTPDGLEKVPGIFISRLVPGGLAESTGLLAVNDEVLEVNGIEVAGKTLDQWKNTHILWCGADPFVLVLHILKPNRNSWFHEFENVQYQHETVVATPKIVTDMMVANSWNLIITVKPANQRTVAPPPRRGSFSRNSQLSSGSAQSSCPTTAGSDDDAYDRDEVVDLTANLNDLPTAVTDKQGDNDDAILHL